MFKERFSNFEMHIKTHITCDECDAMFTNADMLRDYKGCNHCRETVTCGDCRKSIYVTTKSYLPTTFTYP